MNLTCATTPGSDKPAAADPPPTRPVRPPRKSVVTEIKSDNLYGDFFLVINLLLGPTYPRQGMAPTDLILPEY